MLVFIWIISALLFASCFLPQALWGSMVATRSRRFHTDEGGFPTEI